MRHPTRSLLFVLAVVSACVTFDVSAHSPLEKEQGGDLAALVERANLVFVGRAARISYRNASPADTKGEGEIPYTIVTYQIDQVLRGEAPGKEITLRVVGGPDGMGRFLTVSGVPIIQEGDQDILFVENPNDPTCPFVFCENGRYRVLGEQVFDTYGSPVRELRKTKILSRGVPPPELRSLRFPVPTFDQLMKNPEAAKQLETQKLAADDARSRYAQEAPRYFQVDQPWLEEEKGSDSADKETKGMAAVDQNTRVSVAEFLAVTTQLAKESKRPATAVRSIDPNATFTAAKLSHLAPPSLQTPAQARRSAADDAEYQALSRNKFNPVIPKRSH
jgi:hypothetical protein